MRFFSGKLLAGLDVKSFALVKDFTLFAQVKGVYANKRLFAQVK